MPMSKTRHPHGPCLLPPACEKDCDDVPRELPHYFTGRVLTARDLRDEQGYVLSRLRLRNRLFHGWGVVCGLDVCSHPDPACRDRYVVVEPGIAIDCCGNDIFVCERSEERRVGKGCVSTFRSRWAQLLNKKKKTK